MAPSRSRRAVLAACALLAFGPAACGDGDDGGQPAGPDVDAQPTGVYRYATEGFERIGGPLPGRLRYPPTTTITVERYGCTLSERWEARPERYAEWRYCVTGATWRLRSVTDYHEFFGNAQRRVYRCTGRAVPRPARIEVGFRWTDRCRARRTTAVARGEVVDTERVRVAGQRVPAVHLRVRTRLGGDVRGAYTMDSWLRRADGLLLRRSFTGDSRVDAIIGAVPAHEEYDLRLRSLVPRD
ncbi:MAG: hypothetical protein ACRDLQ_09665 [Solirubrobacterales bacterium]